MSTEQNRTVATRDFLEVWSKGNVDLIGEVYTPNVVRHDLGASVSVQGLQGIRQAVEGYRGAFPDLRFTVEDAVAEGEKVVIRWTAEATHRGEFKGIPPTGKKVNVAGISASHFSDGKICESWVSWDALGLLKQLGVIPE